MKVCSTALWVAAMALAFVVPSEALAIIRVTIRPVTLQTAGPSDTTATLPTAQTQFVPGETFVVELWAQTTETNGLSSVTVDLSFVNTVVTAQTITHTALFNAAGLSTGTINNPGGLVDNLGGSHAAASPPCSDQVGLTNWARVAIVDMQALANGTSVIQSADTASLILGTAICNEFGNVLPVDIDFGQVTVTVQECFDNTDCDDAQFCNGPEQCVGNVCQAGTAPNCADAIGCTDDSCDFAANAGTGACLNVPNDANCDDNQFCNGAETCSATLDCQAGTAPNCADAIGCTDDSCDFAANGGTGACLNAPNDANCDDNQFCNGAETCSATLDCQAGTAPNCADAIGCTDDSCDFAANAGTGACLNAPNDANCDDNQFCNGAETCSATLDCQAGTAPNCADAIGCTDDSCDFAANAGTGACLNAPNDANCDDNQFCNGAETCSATLDCQAGTAPNCADAIGCTDDSCDFAANAGTGACLNAPNDANCDDNQFCNGAETCSAPLDCQAGTAPNCADAIGCTDDSCDFAANAGTGACLNAPNDANCDDNQFCNGAETCSATLDCQAGTAPNCADAICCTDDSCDFAANAGTGACLNAPNDANCDDNLFCNGAETCSATLDCQTGAAVCTASCEHCDEAGGTCELCILDLDFNGVMGTGDFALFAACFDGCYLATDPCAASNFDGDAGICVGTGDFSGFVGCFGQACADCGNCAGPPPARATGRNYSIDSAAVINLVTVLAPTTDDSVAVLPTSKTTYRIGQPFYIEVWATRPIATAWTGDGLAAVFVDLSFDANALLAKQVISSNPMSTFAGGNIHPGLGLVSQLGGCSKLDSPNLGAEGQWVRVATLAVRAMATGNVMLEAGPSDANHGVAIVNELGNIDPILIDFGRATLNIVPKPIVDKVRRRLRDGGRL